MRSEQQMMELILDVAKKDDRVRAVAMNGSRTNPNVPKDIFQDYDIVYLVTDMKSFIVDKGWVDIFGERIIMQTPEDMSMFPPELGGRFSYLMQFTDGNRIDLTLVPIEQLEDYASEDKLTVVLLDKDNRVPPISEPTDEDYWAKPPSPEFFADCCNEFWWVTTYVAKGLWRKEILYAQEHLNIVRRMLINMLEWQVGIQTDFSVSIGKCGKYLEKYISKEEWQMLLYTYAGGNYSSVWNALFAACELFRSSSKKVASYFDYKYPHEDDEHVTAYLKYVQELPSNSTVIYL